MALFTATVRPGEAVGCLVLGASLHDVITRLKAEPQTFTKLDLVYSPASPVAEPVILDLPENGLRLRFDGTEQRLRLIEVLDFSKSELSHKSYTIAKTKSLDATAGPEDTSGPQFKHVYNTLMGPTFPGEYLPPANADVDAYGVYVLSYPGIAFSFPVPHATWSPEKAKDYAAFLSSSQTRPASSVAIFRGESWTAARKTLYTRSVDDYRSWITQSKGRENAPDEIRSVNIHGAGDIEMTRMWTAQPFKLTLGATTPQELVAELGPPDAIYRKNDQRMMIHRPRAGGERRQHRGGDSAIQDDSTDTDQSSVNSTNGASDGDSESDQGSKAVAGECFYNYFYHGFDILVSPPTPPSQRSPNQSGKANSPITILPTAPFVATKIILHSNLPGSYSFNRHRRCRWEIRYLSPSAKILNSEMPFDEIATLLHDEWRSIYGSVEEAKQHQRGMVLNRSWGDSPGSSIELIGGSDDNGNKRAPNAVVDEGQGLGNTTLYGFPGLVFEVLKNGYVSGLTVF